MIKTLKNTIKEIYDWIKDKVIRFKKWLIIFIFGAAVVAAPLVLPPIPDIALENIQADYHASELKDKYRLEKTAFILDAVDENAIQAEVGNKNLDKFTPELTLRKWNDEVNFKVKYKHGEKEKDQKVDIENKKIKWKGKKTEVHYYDIKKGELLHDKVLESDVFEVEVLLLEKPATNIVSFDIETTGLNFFYQPDVLQENEVHLDGILNIILKENPKTVLDFGGGKGDLAKQLIENRIDATVIDVSQEAYDNRVVDKFILGDIFEELPKMADDSFDLVIDIGVLKYIEKEKADELVYEIKRVSKKSIHFIGYGSWAPEDIEYGEIDYNFWKDKFTQTGDEADLYKISSVNRADNIIGSYAVYHTTKKNHIIGQKNYQAGKAFHIFRPKIIDSAGTEVWGKLNITNNLLTVEIPQEFLDNAVYPVRHAAGLLFGYDTMGTTSETAFDGIMVGSMFDGIAGDGVSITVGIDDKGGVPQAKGCLYKHSNSTKITNGETEQLALGGNNTPTWETYNFSTAPTLVSQEYVIVFSSQNQMYIDPALKYDDGDTNQGHYEALSPDLNFPATANFSHNNNKYSIYCTYTAEAAERRIIIIE